jgi:hypothetical protein
LSGKKEKENCECSRRAEYGKTKEDLELYVPNAVEASILSRAYVY